VGRKTLLDQERGSYLKKWTGRIPVALVYPNSYDVGMSSLGFQLVYSLLNADESIVCERFFLPGKNELLRSVESGRTLDHFSLIFFSVSFEHDYINLIQLLLMAGVEPFAEDREEQISGAHPLVICGGVATFMNPEPIAQFIDLFVIGEAEPLVPCLVSRLLKEAETKQRTPLLRDLVREQEGLYSPIFYTPKYNTSDRYIGYEVEDGLPIKIKKIVAEACDTASHSQVMTPAAEFADLYLTELGRGCSRGCRFCAAGFIYRPPRLWDGDAVVKGLNERFPGIQRIGLLGMEMADKKGLEAISQYLAESGCSLSFSSLRADRISQPLLELLAASNLKSVAIAPDGASERLRRVINKGLKEEDLLNAAERLVEAGIYKLKVYIMIGLPTENFDDLQELLDLIAKIKERISLIGRKRGRLCEISLSLNSFTPKPWTPFQYHPFGVSGQVEPNEPLSHKEVLATLKDKIKFLRKGLAGEANVQLQTDKPENVLFQAILSRGDRRLSRVLLDMAMNGKGWKQSMKSNGLQPEDFAVRGYDNKTPFPWEVIDHGIDPQYLWREYLKSFSEKYTASCDTKVCRRCGVCRAE
jgi:radical SAM superfamily enzyme YgiQ (UPF0313 family)